MLNPPYTSTTMMHYDAEGGKLSHPFGCPFSWSFPELFRPRLGPPYKIQDIHAPPDSAFSWLRLLNVPTMVAALSISSWLSLPGISQPGFPSQDGAGSFLYLEGFAPLTRPLNHSSKSWCEPLPLPTSTRTISPPVVHRARHFKSP